MHSHERLLVYIYVINFLIYSHMAEHRSLHLHQPALLSVLKSSEMHYNNCINVSFVYINLSLLINLISGTTTLGQQWKGQCNCNSVTVSQSRCHRYVLAN